MSNAEICPRCGNPKDRNKPICSECYGKSQPLSASSARQGDTGRSHTANSYSSFRGGRTPVIPQECIFRTFYTQSQHLRREIFLEGAQKMVDVLSNAPFKAKNKAGLTQGQIRNVFHQLKNMEKRIRKEPGIHVDEVREELYRAMRNVEARLVRDTVPELFVDFLKKHLDIAASSKEEFVGFVQYLESILARLGTK
jgi:CRISPR/Cas system CSM-associated protein Csm2 small subunit